MENSLDHQDEVRRLQDKVRKLELELKNEQLRAQKISKNYNEFEAKPNILSSLLEQDNSIYKWDDAVLKPEELYLENYQDEETWLCKPKRDTFLGKNTKRWILQDFDNKNDLVMQSYRRELLDRFEEIEQGSQRSFIDTRTFTRPKKRMTRPGLDIMTERTILENRQVLESPWSKQMSKQATEMIDDVTELSLLLNNSIHNENSGPKTPDSDKSSNSRKGSDAFLNTTIIKGHPPLSSNLNRTINIALNCTFSHPDNRGRAVSCDSVADDDQLSSASDSSFSSTTRLMNLGDVQTIARLQEESLKQMTSTPKRNNSHDVITLVNEENNLSPIKYIAPEAHQGYLSDHSDHSSIEGRARSAKSSVRSSPSGSPFGSTNTLANVTYRPSLPSATLTLRQGSRAPLPPVNKAELQIAGKSGGDAQRRIGSALRPPNVRSGIATRPSTVRVSNIPRPASRIPAPRVRSSIAPPKNDWKDGCY